MFKKIIFIFFFNIFLCSFVSSNSGKLKNISDYKIIENRNLFHPIWRSENIVDRVEFRQVILRQNDDFLQLKKQQEQERLLQLQQDQEKSLKLKDEQEKRDLENKKKIIEQKYKLNGILHDNGLQAIVVDNNSVSYFLKVNEKFDDLKLINIDERRGSIRLSYKDKIEVTLYMD